MNNEKPAVVYLHRYPPETEALQWPALREFAAAMSRDWRLVYLCMGPADGRRDPALRAAVQTEELPWTVDQSDGRDKWRKTLKWYGAMGGLLRRIRDLRPAAVVCKETLPWIPGRVVALGIPTVITTSDWWWSILLGGSRPGRRFADAMEAREVRSWNRPHVRGVVGTAAEGRLLAAKGMDPDRIVVVPAAQNPGVFRPLSPRPAKEELGLDPALKHFAICGIIRGGKGYDQLLDWWKTAVARHPDWRLVIIGGAGGESWCRREIAKRRLQEAVVMTGWLPTKQDVNRWLNAMDGVLAHRRNSPDNQGIVPSALFNGMSTGRPVAASGLPGMAELLRDGVDGFLYRPDDGDSFIAALERIVADPAAADALGAAGARRAAECFDPVASAEGLKAVVDTLVHQ
jgi:glycosyltransferase involved in cell wall biosynthesis